MQHIVLRKAVIVLLLLLSVWFEIVCLCVLVCAHVCTSAWLRHGAMKESEHGLQEFGSSFTMWVQGMEERMSGLGVLLPTEPFVPATAAPPSTFLYKQMCLHWHKSPLKC